MHTTAAPPDSYRTLGTASTPVRLYPFGGVGEFGMNCLAIEQGEEIMVVDCGAMFSQQEAGIDVQHPDFSWLVARAERVVGLVLTHGHEDHIGGVLYLLDRLNIPVWGPPHALRLVKQRASERATPPALDLREILPRRQYSVGGFLVEPVRVAHSIVEATALCIRTAAGVIVHTGDFNFDPDPPDGEPTDSARLRELGDAGVGLLLSDSTNVDVPERLGSERQVGVALERVLGECSGRAVIGMFASNVQRLILLGDIAQRLGRKLCLLGRGLRQHTQIASELGYLRWPSDLLLPPEQAAAWPRAELLVLAGGSQAEPGSALRRLGSGTHPALRLEAGDSVLLSSRIIPGNDRAVHSLICDFLRQQVNVRHPRTDPDLHTSGHAGQSEQLRMLELLRPKAFVPLHGSFHHLLRHAELARSAGVTEIRVVENGTPFEFAAERLRVLDAVPCSKVAIALGGSVLDAPTQERRSQLGRGGAVMVSGILKDGTALHGPVRVFFCGVPVGPDLERARHCVEGAVRQALAEMDGRYSEESARSRVRRVLEDLCGYKPIVEIHLLRTSND